MLELGEDEAGIHRRTGESLAELGIDILIAVGRLGKELVEGAAAAGFPHVLHAESSDAAAEILIEMVQRDDVVLVKGSRGVRTERVIVKLLEKYELEGGNGTRV
jgi:UDP-N-acetylmuramoyl-tripeptide--D-alanyl-D-alanine ligase